MSSWSSRHVEIFQQDTHMEKEHYCPAHSSHLSSWEFHLPGEVTASARLCLVVGSFPAFSNPSPHLTPTPSCGRSFIHSFILFLSFNRCSVLLCAATPARLTGLATWSSFHKQSGRHLERLLDGLSQIPQLGWAKQDQTGASRPLLSPLSLPTYPAGLGQPLKPHPFSQHWAPSALQRPQH